MWQRNCPICGTLLNKSDPSARHVCPKCLWMWGEVIRIFTGRVMAHLGQVWLDNYTVADLRIFDNKRIRLEFMEVLDG